MTSNSINKAFGITKNLRTEAKATAEDYNAPLNGTYLLHVQSANIREVNHEDAITPNLHIFCKVGHRRVNLDMCCWNAEGLEGFQRKVAHIMSALGTEDLKKFPGKTMMARITPRVKKGEEWNVRFAQYNLEWVKTA